MIPIAKPFLDEAESLAVRDAILSGWVTQGPRVRAFEDAFATRVGAPYACAVSSGTTALHLALLAVGVRPGDVVLTVSHSFIATANCIRHCQAEPVFLDIDTNTYNLDVGRLQQCLENDCEERQGALWYRHAERLAHGESPLRYIRPPLGRVGAILAVHQMGFPCDMKRILQVAKTHGLPVVEDAACAIGSEISHDGAHTWEMIGKPHGDIACFSFHPRKVMTTGDGGMLTTRNRAYDEKFRLWRQHGMSIPDATRHAAPRVQFEEYATTGFNYRMTDIQAAVGLEQLKKLDFILKRRRELAACYGKLLDGVPWVKPAVPEKTALPNWQSYPIQLTGGGPCERDQVMQLLLDQGISTRRGIMNAHQEPAYAEQKWELSKSETCRDSAILLPLFPELAERDVEHISMAICKILH